MRTWRAGAAAVAALALLVGCSPIVGTSPSAGPTTSATPTPTATSPTTLDLRDPGAAQTMVRDLVRASSSQQVIMVSVRAHEASVGVLVDGNPVTWAYRDGAITRVNSDLAYVGQASFDPATFDLSDVGALFRTAAAVSGSASEQELQIVDLRRVEHSALELTMSVSTNPETRTVFFNSDGTLVPTLDFNTADGIATGLADAIGTHTSVTALTVDSAAGASITYQADDGSTVIRTRTSKVPVTDVPRSAVDDLPEFNPRLVSAATIWRVLQRYAASGDFGPTTPWSVSTEMHSGSGQPRLRFTIGTASLITDLQGSTVSP